MEIDVKISKRVCSGSRVFDLSASFSSGGKFVVLFGPSGSGKTLTVKSISGLETPDSGRIIIGDKVLFDSDKGINIAARKRKIGYVFQDYALFPHLSVYDNISFGMKKGLWGKLNRKEMIKVEEFLDIFEIRGIRDSFPAKISGGQRQRVALARALIKDPDLLLLDEPFSALDPLLRGRLRDKLLKISDRFSVPVVMITHDPEDINHFADTLVVYDSGTISKIWPFFKREKKRFADREDVIDGMLYAGC